MATAFPYTPNPGNIRKFLHVVQDAGVPTKLTHKALEGYGFKSKNDRYIIGALKRLGFVDEGGAPTERWRAYRNAASGPRVLGEALQDCYSGLFTHFPDAHRRSADEIRNYMAANTDSAKVTLDRMVATFRSLAEVSEFGPAGAPRQAGSESNPRSQTAQSSEAGAQAPSPGASGRQDLKEYREDGLLIQIIPSKQRIKRAINFLKIFEDQEETAS